MNTNINTTNTTMTICHDSMTDTESVTYTSQCNSTIKQYVYFYKLNTNVVR